MAVDEEQATTEGIEAAAETEAVETEETVEGEGDEGESQEPDAFDGERTKLKGALSKERQRAKDAEKRARVAEAALAAKDRPAEETAIEEARREAAAEASSKANARIVSSEIRAAATGKFADPKDALAFLDLAEFEVDENGDVDADAIEDALTDLLEKKPHLGVAKKKLPNYNQGAKAPATPAQLTQAEYESLSRSERAKARKDGRVSKLLGAN